MYPLDSFGGCFFRYWI